MKLNSVIFHSNRLSELRDFYENKLALTFGSYEKNGIELPDCSETYVNYDIGGVLLCFEVDNDRSDIGTVVFKVENFSILKIRLEQAGIKIISGNEFYFKIKDTEGRGLIFESI